MLPCLRAGYHAAITEMVDFVIKISAGLSNDSHNQLCDKLTSMMENKKAVDWDILRKEQVDVIDEVITERENTPTDGR